MAEVDMKDKGLLNHLRKWGLKVEAEEGWRHRGRPYNFYPKALLVHHTASNRNSGNMPSLGIVRDGRPGIPGPLSQVLLGRDGTVRMIADGYANHAGYGGPRAGIPANQGNTYALGIEAENNGIGEPWPKEQLNAYYRLCAALMDWLRINDVNKVIGHKEWTSRKIDPAGIDMDKFRANVEKARKQGPSVTPISVSKLQPGKRNAEVVKLKKRLRKKGFFTGPKNTNFYGAGLKTSYKKYQESLGYRGTDADGVPGKDSLRKLGFKPVK